MRSSGKRGAGRIRLLELGCNEHQEVGGAAAEALFLLPQPDQAGRARRGAASPSGRCRLKVHRAGLHRIGLPVQPGQYGLVRDLVHLSVRNAAQAPTSRYDPPMAHPSLTLEPAKVLTTTEARTDLPKLAAAFHAEGIEGEIVFFGPHRRPDGAIVPAAMLKVLAPFLEDIVIAERIRQRRAEDTGERISMAELVAGGQFNADEVSAEAEKLAAELGA